MSGRMSSSLCDKTADVGREYPFATMEGVRSRSQSPRVLATLAPPLLRQIRSVCGTLHYLGALRRAAAHIALIDLLILNE
jgi:hypothetical protein